MRATLTDNHHSPQSGHYTVRHDRPLTDFLLIINAALLTEGTNMRRWDPHSELAETTFHAIENLRTLGADIAVQIVADQFPREKRKHAFKAWLTEHYDIDADRIFETDIEGEHTDALVEAAAANRHTVYVEAEPPSRTASLLAYQKVVVLHSPLPEGIEGVRHDNLYPVSDWPFVAPAAVSLAVNAA